jgi:hypothetical protein
MGEAGGSGEEDAAKDVHEVEARGEACARVVGGGWVVDGGSGSGRRVCPPMMKKAAVLNLVISPRQMRAVSTPASPARTSGSVHLHHTQSARVREKEKRPLHCSGYG